MFSLGSFLLISACILICSRTITADNVLTCNIPVNFTVQISNDQIAHLYQSELTVRVPTDGLSVISYPGINSVNVRGNGAAVAFKAYLALEDVNWRIVNQPERIQQIYTDRISGIAERIPQNSTDTAVHDCRLVLLPTETERPSVHVRIANEIRRLAESCVELELCPRIGSQKAVVSPSQSGSGLLSVYTDPLVVTALPARNNELETSGLKFSHGTFQSAINKLVDIALAEIIQKLREKNEGTIDVANINKEFSTGSGIFKTNGRFEAVDGKLRDLTTIRRTTDATLSHSGMKFVASCGFGLQVLNLNYNRYRLKYGIIKVNGMMSADINGMALEARVAADYNQEPCVMELEELEVTELGKMKIHVTGLSPLNSLVSKLLDWITKQWNEDIVHMIEKKLRSKVQERLANFNCEKFRP